VAADAFRVWFRTEPPRPSWTLYKSISRGVLTVFEEHAEFTPNAGPPTLLTDVRSVRKGWQHQVHGIPLLPVVDTWIEIIYGTGSAVYVNDGRWYGLGTYLPHRRMIAALTRLVDAAAPNGG
jgi:hypothetical protein